MFIFTVGSLITGSAAAWDHGYWRAVRRGGGKERLHPPCIILILFFKFCPEDLNFNGHVDQRNPTSAAKSSTENKQKGNHGNHACARSLLRCFWCIVWQKYSATYRPGICGSSCLLWTDTFLVPIACGRKTFLITISVRFRYRPRVAAA